MNNPIQISGKTYFPLCDCPRYYADRDGNVVTMRYKEPRSLYCRYIHGTPIYFLTISGKRVSVRATRVAYCIRNGVSLESISGKYVFVNGDKLELHSDERFAGVKAQIKRRMNTPKDGKVWMQRARAELDLFVAWYERGDINPLEKYISRLKGGLISYAINKWYLSEMNAGRLADEACSFFFLRLCECDIIRFGIEGYLKRTMTSIYKRDASRRKKEGLTDNDYMYQSYSLSDWEDNHAY